MTFVIFQSPSDLHWYWHARAANNEIVAHSEAYTRRASATRAANRFIFRIRACKPDVIVAKP